VTGGRKVLGEFMCITRLSSPYRITDLFCEGSLKSPLHQLTKKAMTTFPLIGRISTSTSANPAVLICSPKRVRTAVSGLPGDSHFKIVTMFKPTLAK
jgi:hypothetical protein